MYYQFNTTYYNKIRTHWLLDKDAPSFLPVRRTKNIASQASSAAFITIACGFSFSVHAAKLFFSTISKNARLKPDRAISGNSRSEPKFGLETKSDFPGCPQQEGVLCHV
jgi:hypothetical protein